MPAKSKENTERINVFFSPDVLARLKEEATERGMSVSGYVRLLVLRGLFPTPECRDCYRDEDGKWHLGCEGW